MSILGLIASILVCFLVLMYGFSLGRQQGIQREREHRQGYDLETLQDLLVSATKYLKPGGGYYLKIILWRNKDGNPDNAERHSVNIPETVKTKGYQDWRNQ